MIDEEQQIDNIAKAPSDSYVENQKMTSEATAQTMNLNPEAATNAPDANATNPSDMNTADENVAQAPSTSAAEYPAALSELTGQVETLKTQVEERSSQYMRIAADFDNFRKRTQKEKEDLELQIKRNTILELLPIVDNFERARSHLKPQTEAEMALHKSYQGVYKQLVDCLKRLGVSAMRPEGKEFDPNLHEAVMREATHEYPEGTVIEELVRGYFLGDRVLRHALVKVATIPDEAPPTIEVENSTESIDN